MAIHYARIIKPVGFGRYIIASSKEKIKRVAKANGYEIGTIFYGNDFEIL
jgi:hypothetical protein